MIPQGYMTSAVTDHHICLSLASLLIPLLVLYCSNAHRRKFANLFVCSKADFHVQRVTLLSC